MATTTVKKSRVLLTPVELQIEAFINRWGVANESKVTDDQREGVMSDATVKLNLAMVNEPIRALDYQIDTDIDDENAETQREFLRLFYEPYIRTLTNLALIARTYGRNTVFRRWQVVEFDGEIKLSLYKYSNPKPQEVTILEDEYKDFVGVKFNNNEYTDKNVFHIVYNGEFNNLYGNSVLDDLYQLWRDYEIEKLYYLRYCERMAGPTIEVGYPDAQGKLDKNKKPIDNSAVADTIGKSIKSTGSVSIPTDTYGESGNRQWEIKALDIPNNGEEFIKFMEHWELLISRALLSPDNAITRSGSTGTFAESKEKADLQSNVIEAVAYFVTEQALQVELDMLLVENFANPVPFKFKFEPVVDAKKELINRMLEKIATDPRANQMLVERLAETMDKDLAVVEDTVLENNELNEPEMPVDTKSQPDGNQQEDIEAEAEFDKLLSLSNKGSLWGI